MRVTDDEAATAALSSLASLTPAQSEAQNQIAILLAAGDEDSFINVHDLFSLYNALYFRSLLLPRVEVIWSPRLTLCAGICELSKDTETKRWSRIRLKLSEPLLRLRPRSDLVNTLLHESIHAYFFITSSFAHTRDPTGGHGSGFQALAAGINAHGGYAVTQFHEFHDEVDSYRTHVWLCNGPCRAVSPYFGLVKRSMNRPPGKSDVWWEKHSTECGGAYEKIGEPEMSKAQVDRLSGMKKAGRQRNKIDSWVKQKEEEEEEDSEIAGHTTSGQKRARSPDSSLSLGSTPPAKVQMIACPICSKAIKDIYINEHLDTVHPP